MVDQITNFAQSNSNDGAAAVAGLGIGLFLIFFWLIIMGIMVAGLVLWIISLIHVLQHDDVKDRVMWIVVLLLVGTIGGIIYFFAVKRPYDKGGMRDPLVLAARASINTSSGL